MNLKSISILSFSLIFLSPFTLAEEMVEKVGESARAPRVMMLNPIVSGNKTIKILNGRPPPPAQNMSPPPPPPNYRPMSIQNGYYPQNNNPQYPQSQYPQTPDLSGEGSRPAPSFQQPQSKPDSDYVQIIGAIEKIVGRIDKLETRLSTLENIVHHLTTKKKDQPQQGNCPPNFVKIDGVRGKCYHVSNLQLGEKDGATPPILYDWQNAHAGCKKMGGRLVEMGAYDDFLRISQFLVKYSDSKKTGTQMATDFWVGGINPGLIWIWSESGQKVGMDRQFWNDNDNSSNAPGCLKMSYSMRLGAFFFKGAPCSHSQNILCEIMDNSVSRALALFEQDLIGMEEKEVEKVARNGTISL